MAGELLLRVGNTVFTGRGDQEMAIYDNRVLITMARLRGVGEESIPYRRIAGVSVKPGFFFSELSIETTGGEVVTVKSIPRGQAWKAYDLINELL